LMSRAKDALTTQRGHITHAAVRMTNK
jgi:hypothetical protein